MHLESAINLESVVSVIQFETHHQEKTTRLLTQKYKIPKSEINRIKQRIIQKINALTNISSNFPQENGHWRAFHTFAAEETQLLLKEMSKNFGLSPRGFDELCDRLRNGDEKLFEQIFLSHFKDCIQYLKTNYKIPHELAYDVSMDTLLQFRHKLIHKKISYGNIRFLFTKMASQVFLKQKAAQQKVTGLTYDSEKNTAESDLQILEQAVTQLNNECQELLKLNFYEKMTLAEIAALKNKSAAAIRKQKQRCIEKLKSLIIPLTN